MNPPSDEGMRPDDLVRPHAPHAALGEMSEAAPSDRADAAYAPPTLPDMVTAQREAADGDRPMQAQPAVRPMPRTPGEAMQSEVPGETPTGLEDDEAEREIRRKSRRSFLWAGVTLAASYAGWRTFTHNPQQDGILSPLRHALQFNQNLTQSYFSPSRLVPTFPVSMAENIKVNGMYGVMDDLDADSWHLKVEGAHGHAKPLMLTMDDIRALPRVEMVVQHKCVEGWSVIVHWAGARFSDFAAKYLPNGRPGQTPDLHNVDTLVRYVSMTTPDGNYYVGLDMPSALHPQTLLAYELNGEPLTDEHGAPVRLVIPIKYGIKSIKRIGTIAYTDTQPADYWAEQGYDWYAGH